jgi:heat shock protein HslJ
MSTFIKPLAAIATLFLLVSSSACTIKNAQQAAEIYTIKDSYWMLISLKGQDLPEVTNTKTAYIRFEEGDNQVKGFTGCNKFTGKYEMTENSLNLSGLSTSRMMCPNIEMENYLIGLLENVTAYQLSDNILTLYHNDEAVATFRAGNRRSIDLEVNDQQQ